MAEMGESSPPLSLSSDPDTLLSDTLATGRPALYHGCQYLSKYGNTDILFSDRLGAGRTAPDHSCQCCCCLSSGPWCQEGEAVPGKHAFQLYSYVKPALMDLVLLELSSCWLFPRGRCCCWTPGWWSPVSSSPSSSSSSSSLLGDGAMVLKTSSYGRSGKEMWIKEIQSLCG